MSEEEKFGERRPHDDDRRPGRRFDLFPLKVERACQCPDHVQMTYSIERDMPSVTNAVELFQLMLAQQPVPTAKQWVPIATVLNGYN